MRRNSLCCGFRCIDAGGTAGTEIVLDVLQHDCGDFEPIGTAAAAQRNPRPAVRV